MKRITKVTLVTKDQISKDEREKNENTLCFVISKLLYWLMEENDNAFDLNEIVFIFANGHSDAEQSMGFIEKNTDMLPVVYLSPIGFAIPYTENTLGLEFNEWSKKIVGILTGTDLHYCVGCSEDNLHTLAKELVDHGRGAVLEEVYVGLPEDIHNN